jgi:hypothetical protein
LRIANGINSTIVVSPYPPTLLTTARCLRVSRRVAAGTTDRAPSVWIVVGSSGGLVLFVISSSACSIAAHARRC